MNHHTFEPGRPVSQPAFNLPNVVVWLGGIMIAIHVLRTFILPASWGNDILIYFAFWPLRYDAQMFASGLAPGGLPADIWSFVTYAFLHGGTAHIVFNLLWMAIFGSAVARRFGVVRFLVLSALCAVGGAFAHLMANFGDAAPMIGASAAVSGYMAAALRFVFESGGPLGAIRRSDAEAYRVPAVSLKQSLQNRKVVAFTAIWFGLNLVFGLSGAAFGGGGGTIAWQAHIGGFVVGLILFPLLDPVMRRRF